MNEQCPVALVKKAGRGKIELKRRLKPLSDGKGGVGGEGKELISEATNTRLYTHKIV